MSYELEEVRPAVEIVNLKIDGETIAYAHPNEMPDTGRWYVCLGKTFGFMVVNQGRARDILNWIGEQIAGDPEVVNNHAEFATVSIGSRWKSSRVSACFYARVEEGFDFREGNGHPIITDKSIDEIVINAFPLTRIP